LDLDLNLGLARSLLVNPFAVSLLFGLMQVEVALIADLSCVFWGVFFCFRLFKFLFYFAVVRSSLKQLMRMLSRAKESKTVIIPIAI